MAGSENGQFIIVEFFWSIRARETAKPVLTSFWKNYEGQGKVVQGKSSER